MNFQIKSNEYTIQFCKAQNCSRLKIGPIQACESSVHRPFVFRYLYDRRPFCSVVLSCISVQSVSSPLLVRWGTLHVRYVPITCPVDIRYSYCTCPFHTPRGSLEQQWCRHSRTDDKRTKVFDSFFYLLDSVRVIR